MFHGEKDAKKKATKITRALAHYTKNKTHERHIHFDECVAMGLKVTSIEIDPDLQDLILTVHHCYMHMLMNTPVFKMIENHQGAALIKQLSQPVK